MNQWIVKAGTLSTPTAWTSKPMSMTEAGKLAETLVDASGFYCDVTIEFYGTPIAENPRKHWKCMHGKSDFCPKCLDINEECTRA